MSKVTGTRVAQRQRVERRRRQQRGQQRVRVQIGRQAKELHLAQTRLQHDQSALATGSVTDQNNVAQAVGSTERRTDETVEQGHSGRHARGLHVRQHGLAGRELRNRRRQCLNGKEQALVAADEVC